MPYWFGESVAWRSLAQLAPSTCPRVLCQSRLTLGPLSAIFLTHRTTSSPGTLAVEPFSFLRAKEICRSLARYVRRNTGSRLEGFSQPSPNLDRPLLSARQWRAL